MDAQDPAPPAEQPDAAQAAARAKLVSENYFKGFSFPVIIIAIFSSAVAAFIVFGAAAFVALQTGCLLVLPLASLLAGAVLMQTTADAEGEPQSEAEVVVFRAFGAMLCLQAFSTLQIARSGCARTKAAHLSAMAVTFGFLTWAVGAHGASAFEVEQADRATFWLAAITASAVGAATLNVLGPALTKKVAAGKPMAPKACAQ